MRRRDDLHYNSHQPRTMTTSFINETADQELQLTDLQDLNGGVLMELAFYGIGLGTGAAVMYLYEHREELADAVHDLISGESESSEGNCTGYREERGSRGGGKYDKPVLK